MTARSASYVLLLPLLAVLIGAAVSVSGQSGVTNGEWPHWGADLGNSKYSALDQINRDNVKNLRVAWRWKSENFGPRPQNNMEATDRKSTRLNSSHSQISYAVFCLKKKKKKTNLMHRE